MPAQNVFLRAAAVAVATAFLLGGLPSIPKAQVGLSPRIHGLGSDFAGLVDDPITDAALNPARLGAIEGKQVYGGVAPKSYAVVNFPSLSWSSGQELNLPQEGYYHSGERPWGNLWTGDPVVLTYFTPLPAGTQGSFTFEVAADGREYLQNEVETSEEYWFNDDIVTKDISNASSSEADVYGVDAAVSTSRDPEAHAYGLRITAFYLTRGDNSLDRRSWIHAPPDNLEQQVLEYDVERVENGHEELGATLTVGVFRPGGVVSELSVSGGFRSVRSDLSSISQSIFDEDADGDNLDPDGFTPDYSFQTSEANRIRELDGATMAGRIVFDRDGKLRAAVEASGRVLSGVGDAEFTRRYIERDIGSDVEDIQSVGYTYDDRYQQARGSVTAGYTDEVASGVLVAAGARVAYRWDRLEEEMLGEARVQSRDGVEGFAIEAPYDQDAFVDVERLTVRLSLGAEWALEKYFTFRAGVSYEARTEETEWLARQKVVGEASLPALFRDGLDEGSVVRYVTDVTARAGLSVRVDDRLFVDFYATSFSFANYSYGTIRYAF